MSTTELPTLSPVLRYSSPSDIVVERGGQRFRIGEVVHLQPEHYRYGDTLFTPKAITLRVLWFGALTSVDGMQMIALEGIEIDPVPDRKRSILADFAALCDTPTAESDAHDAQEA